MPYERLLGTGATEMCRIGFTRSGLTKRKREYSWSEITSAHPDAEARVVVYAGDQPAAIIDYMIPNAEVALPLIRVCRSRFGVVAEAAALTNRIARLVPRPA